MGGLPGRCDTGQRGEPGAVPSHQTRGGAGPGTRAGGCSLADQLAGHTLVKMGLNVDCVSQI